jgi:hypothetical protein
MSKRRVTFVGIASFIFLLCACPVALAQLFTPEQTLSQAHAYEGSPRPVKQIATVFAAPRKSTGLATQMCKVDGKSLFRFGWSSSCPQVIYLLPGTHQLAITQSIPGAGTSSTIPIQVEAGKTYMVGGTVLWEKDFFGTLRPRRAATSISAMPEGFALTYKDIYPTYYASGDKPNSRINPEDAK